MSEAPGTNSAPADGPIPPQPSTPVPPVPARSKGDLVPRMLTASVLVSSIGYCLYAGGLLFLIVLIGIILLAQAEFYALIRAKGARPLVGFGLTAGAAIPIVVYLGTEANAMLLITATLLITMLLQLGKAEIVEAMASISGTFFGIFYIGWLMSHCIGLRFFHDVVASRYTSGTPEVLGIPEQAGIFFMFFTVTCVAMADTGAYFAGRAYGRHVLAPAISPGKTVEGAIGGMVVGILGGFVAMWIFDAFWPGLSAFFDWRKVLIFGTVVSAFSTVGDLIESMLKRDAAVKDAGRLLPGMGGIMDRIDGQLLGFPLMYYMLLFSVYLEVG